MTNFAEYANVYDLLYRDKNYAGEARFVRDLLAAHGAASGGILDLGCGTGLHDIAFAGMGFRMLGVDLSYEMIARAEDRRKSLTPAMQEQMEFRQGDIRRLDCGRIFDAVISLFHVMCYQIEDDDVDCAMRTARRHLPHGAPFVFDFWYGPAIAEDGPQPREKTVRHGPVQIRRVTRPTWLREQNRVIIDYEIEVVKSPASTAAHFKERHVVRYFFVDELDRALRAAGFKPAAWGEWMTTHEPSRESFAAYVVAIAQ